MTETEIKVRAGNGHLHRRHRGVYIVGHTALAPRANERAALLASGERAVLSHRSAAHLWRLTEDPPPVVDVTLIGRRCRPKDGVRGHTTSVLERSDIRRRYGLPLTSPARTLIDLAAEVDASMLDRLVAEARALKLLRDGELQKALPRAGARSGVAAVRAFLQNEQDPALTRRKGLARAGAGYRVIRITWRQLVNEPLFVAVQLACALTNGS